ncbi:hypothetical protein [Stutzerimonas nitrititolerans]|uniref:hypothetical protein n=1 Tax=Stutzerimonas nitrititolerans TaxID=2482751 RepID=UPI0028AD4908|nr:hypothetical protein [Stutzerimonas nitrititolerans]
MAKSAADSLIISAQKALREAAERLQDADATRSQSTTLLRPTDILEGKVDAGKLWKYMTTRGGKIRPLTMDDLLEFERTANKLGKRYQKGIKPRDVIDLSLTADLQRARQEIRDSIPLTVKAGEMRFMTNAGPKSDVKRHYVTVKLLNFEAAVVASVSPQQIVKQVINGNCSVSCDCGRWRFWYAYMATKGGYNANPNHREGAYPKIRNPNLHGLACKHILRVMTSLTQSAAIRAYIVNMITNERDKVQTKLQRVAQSEMKDLAAKMAKEGSRTRQVKTTAEKRAQRQAQPSYQRQQAARRAQAELNKAAKLKPAANRVVREDAQVALMMTSFGWTREQAIAALGAAKGK